MAAMYVPPTLNENPEDLGRPSYGVLLTSAGTEEVVSALAAARFTGWVAPGQDGWCVAIAEHPLGMVAAGRRGLPALAADLSGVLGTATIAVVIRRERLLTLTAYDGGAALVSYLSDAQQARPGDEFAWGPQGAGGGHQLARLCGVPGHGEETVEVLAEEHGEDENESERLMALARILGWPRWLVAVPGLPRRLSGGPAVGSLVRLRAGRRGLAGVITGRATQVVRRTDLTER